MDVTTLCRELLAIGRSGEYADVGRLPGAGEHRQVLRVADMSRKAITTFFELLDEPDRNFFFKAVAAYENTVGGLGSVTILHRLLPLLPGDGRDTLDWVLSNTRSYWYYVHSATSIAEMKEFSRIRAELREHNLQLEKRREIEAKALKGDRATTNLYNAVRRGDIRAVQALLNAGANANITTPDGAALHEYAASKGRDDIAELLIKTHGAQPPSLQSLDAQR